MYIAVLDCMKQIQYIGKGRGGVAGLQVASKAHIHGGKVLGHLTRIFWGILDPLILITSVYILCRLPMPGHRYLPSTPISLSFMCNSSCALVKL